MGAVQAVRFRAAVKASAVRAVMADVSLTRVVGSALGAQLACQSSGALRPYQTAKRRYYRSIEMGVSIDC